MPAAAKIPVVLYCAFNGCGNRKAHGAGEGLGGGESAFRDEFAGTAHALHSQDRDSALVGDGQNVVLKATEVWLQ